MKLDLKETHDRYQQFVSKEMDIGKCCQQIIDQRPFGNRAFYIFSHARTHDNGVTKRIIWQPRLTRPKAQTNSMLFKVRPGSDEVRIIWMIPAREMWDQYAPGKVCDSPIVWESINAFKHNRDMLEAKDKDDLSDEEIDKIYRDMSIRKQPIFKKI